MDVAEAIGQGRYIALDVAETLSTFMVNDLPDPGRFFKVAGDLLVAAAEGGKRQASPEFGLVVSVRLPCMRRVRPMRRSSLNTSGTK